tara:strand:+ start:543 stop:776 length:234 start_codon:yes stop_codon:yes gene_type:complete
MSPLKPMIIGLLMLTTALAGCVDGDNHPDHHDDEPGLHHHGDEDYHHQHDENDETDHAESDRHHCHDDQNEPTSNCP